MKKLDSKLKIRKKNKKNRKYSARVFSTGDGVAKIVGLKTLQMGEVVVFHKDDVKIKGLVVTVHRKYARVAIFGADASISQNLRVTKNGELARVPVGPKVLGRIIDPIGNVLDGYAEIKKIKRIKSDRKAKGIIYRQSIKQPLLTGVLAVDTMIPIGKGQRELIIGDRKTGKTSIAIDTIINQNRQESDIKVLCVYVAIGQKKSTVVQIARTLAKTNSFYYSTIVSATADDAAALQYLAPYSGSSIGEYYRDKGQHALVVLDDLSKHAAAYRQMALLVRRPPGRDAYPGDVFYLHSRLLERGSKLSDTIGGGSLTAFPIIETQGNDVSAYIPTNVISITDGQIYIDKRIARKGRWPAINIGLSVSRIGSAAQLKSIKDISGALKLQLTQYYEVEHFISFASEIDDETWKTLERGLRILEILKQKRYQPLSVNQQLILLHGVLSGSFDTMPIGEIANLKVAINIALNRILKRNKDALSGPNYKTVLAKLANTVKNAVDIYGTRNPNWLRLLRDTTA